MTDYHHSFESVEDYLHHRSPYLLVQRVVSISPTEVVTEKMISGEEPYLAGHFPGQPIFPGAMMQELSTQSAGILIAAQYNPMERYNTHDPFANEFALGVLVRVKQARYTGFARPNDTLCVRAVLNQRVSGMFDFSATITVENRTIMRNRFLLTNIPAATLQGIGASGTP